MYNRLPTLPWQKLTIHLMMPHAFNPHPHTEDDSGCLQPWYIHANFNPHPHMEGDAPGQFLNIPAGLFQSTPSHGGWPSMLSSRWFGPGISIHTLTRRMTSPRHGRGFAMVISIHILTRRMTQKDGRVSKVGTISIHILTRRMTHPRRHPSLLGSISIHILTRRMTAAFGISYSKT